MKILSNKGEDWSNLRCNCNSTWPRTEIIKDITNETEPFLYKIKDKFHLDNEKILSIEGSMCPVCGLFHWRVLG